MWGRDHWGLSRMLATIPGISDNWIFHWQFYKCDDWKNFPQTIFWLLTFQTLSLLHNLHATYINIWPLALWLWVLMPGVSTQWVIGIFLKANSTPTCLQLGVHHQYPLSLLFFFLLLGLSCLTWGRKWGPTEPPSKKPWKRNHKHLLTTTDTF